MPGCYDVVDLNCEDFSKELLISYSRCKTRNSFNLLKLLSHQASWLKDLQRCLGHPVERGAIFWPLSNQLLIMCNSNMLPWSEKNILYCLTPGALEMSSNVLKEQDILVTFYNFIESFLLIP